MATFNRRATVKAFKVIYFMLYNRVVRFTSCCTIGWYDLQFYRNFGNSRCRGSKDSRRRGSKIQDVVALKIQLGPEFSYVLAHSVITKTEKELFSFVN